MKKWLGNLLGALALVSAPVFAQSIPEGLFQGYDGEWKHVSKQLIDLAEATPAEKFSWRPAPGVRSTSEVYMHIAIANFGLLSFAGPKMPEGSEKRHGKNGNVEGRGNQLAEALAHRGERSA